jgi:hypothetical protein
VKRTAIALVILTVGWGCTTRSFSSNQFAAVAPGLSVERFLQAANTRDLAGMARLFGTASGPIGDTGSTFGCFWKKIGTALGGQSCEQWSDIELRMDAIAEILRHQDYQFSTERAVAGTSDQMTRIGVDMSFDGERMVRDVGFTVVLGSGDRWFIQVIELEKITSS